MKNLKILLATPSDGGPATYTKLLKEKLPERGFRVKAIEFGSVLWLPKVVRHFWFMVKVFFSGLSSDLIYAQDPVSTGLPAFVAAKLLGKKFVLKIVGDYAWEQGSQRAGVSDLLDDFSENFEKYPLLVRIFKKIQKFVANKSHQIVVPSEYLKKIVVNWGIDPSKIKVIYNAFDEPNLYGSKEEIRKELGWERRVMVSVGRLVPWKGFDTLIGIMSEILNIHPDVELYIVGDGPDKSYLRNKVKELKLEENVFFTGKIAHSDTLRYMKASDLFVLNTSYEGFSHVILEALAVETPIITTPVGGNVEIIEDNINGRLFPYNDKEKLKVAILELLDNQGLRESFASSGKKKVTGFSETKMLDSLALTLVR